MCLLSFATTKLRVTPVCLIASLLMLSGTVSAEATDAPTSTVVERLLDILLRQKTITQEQYDELLEEARREEAAAAAHSAEAAPATESVAGEPPEWAFEWDNGFRLERADGAFELEFGGRVQLDGAAIWESSGLDDDLAALGENGQGDGVEFRRARIFFEGTVYDRLFFKAQYDFAGGDPEFKDVYMGLREVGPLGTLQVGQFKEPFFLNEQTSSNYITFMERALNNAFLPEFRNVGVMAMNTAAKQRFLWQVGVFRATDDFGDAFSSFDDTDWDTAVRLSGLPLWSDDGARLLHLGAAYIHRFRGEEASFQQRPESHLASNFVDTMSLDASGIDILGAELAWVRGPLSIQGEYTHSFVNGDDGQADVDFWGAYAQVSYFLTGEHRSYELGSGKFGRVKPRASFNPARGDWGAFELAARFSYLDLNDRAVRGGELWDVTAGMNWYLFPNARIMLNYVHADVSDREAVIDMAPVDVSGSGDIVQTRFQVDF